MGRNCDSLELSAVVLIVTAVFIVGMKPRAFSFDTSGTWAIKTPGGGGSAGLVAVDVVEVEARALFDEERLPCDVVATGSFLVFALDARLYPSVVKSISSPGLILFTR